jgi:hypothetical protein
MTPNDYYILILESVTLYNATFEYWLSFTFAFNAVCYFSTTNLSNKFLYALMALYFFASVLFTLRFANRAIQLGNIYLNMDANNIPPPPWITGSESLPAGLIQSGMFWLMVIGSLASICFAYSQARTRNGT